jgi:5-methylcytosine-specific restriction endonuclease McrA
MALEELDYIPSTGNPRHKRGEILMEGFVRKYLRGDIRKSDGFVFVVYTKEYRKRSNDYVMRETWSNPQAFERMLAVARIRVKEHNERDPEAAKQRRKASNARCMERIIRNSREWAAKNRERSREIKSKWRIANPDQTNKLAAKRRSRRRNALLMLHRDQEQIINTIYDCSRRVSKCLNIPHEVDHIIPISRGGYHIHTNMQIIPMRLNRSKSDKLPHELTTTT